VTREATGATGAKGDTGTRELQEPLVLYEIQVIRELQEQPVPKEIQVTRS